MRWISGLWLVAVTACSFDHAVDGLPVVSFSTPASGADEKTAVVMVPVVLSPASVVEVSVSYEVLAGGTADAGDDFTLEANQRLVFAPGELEKLIPVRIAADGIEGELDESFQIALEAPTNAQLDEDHAIHSIRIADHILPRVSIGPGFTSSSEATPSQLLVKLDLPAEQTSMVTLGVSVGGPFPATAADFTLADNTIVTIAKGETQKLVDIGEQNDELDEEDEEVIAFSLRGASDSLVVGESRTIDHKILDNDDPPTVSFATTASLDEAGTQYLLTVSLDKPSGRTLSVNYNRDGGDSAADDDATVAGSPGTLTFLAGETSKTVTIAVANDNVDEDDETVVVSLTSPVNVTVGTPTHTLTIVDNDTATVSFLNGSTTVDEDDAGGASIVVRLATPSSKTVTVPFSVNTGMTTAESDDFNIVTQSPLVFAPGVTQMTIEIDVPDNAPFNENGDRVVIDLGTPTNAPLGTQTRHTLNITE